MDSYPAFIVDQSSKWSWVDQRLITRSRANVAKTRLLGSGKKKSFTVVHKYLTAANLSTLETFYDANRGELFTFTWYDGTSYTVMFGDKDGINFAPSSQLLQTTTITLLEA